MPLTPQQEVELENIILKNPDLQKAQIALIDANHTCEDENIDNANIRFNKAMNRAVEIAANKLGIPLPKGATDDFKYRLASTMMEDTGPAICSVKPHSVQRNR